MKLSIGSIGGVVKGLFSGGERAPERPSGFHNPRVDMEAMEHLKMRTATAANVSAAVWTPENHDRLLLRAFPSLRTTGELHVMQKGSRSVDVKYGAPITLIEGQAYKHAMTPGHKVREFEAKGMSHDRAISAAQDWARGEAQKFVDGKGEEARRLQREYERAGGKGLSPKALYAWGEGAHTIMDNTSPAHKGFQVYDLNEYAKDNKGALFDAGAGFDFGSYAIDMMHHKGKESGMPTEAEYAETTKALQNYFRDVFGEEQLRRAREPATTLEPIPQPHPTPTPPPSARG